MKAFYLQGHKFRKSSSYHIFLSIKVLYILHLKDNEFNIYKIFNLKNKYNKDYCFWNKITYKIRLVCTAADVYSDNMCTLDLKDKTYYLSEDLNYLINKKKSLEIYL